jgi:hypothetical protein
VQYPQSSCGFAIATRKGDGVRRTPINDLPTLYLRLMLKMGGLPQDYLKQRGAKANRAAYDAILDRVQ